MSISRVQVKLIILLCSATAYIISLFIPALLLGNRAPIVGLTILASGWLGILYLEFAWFANLVYIFAFDAYVAANRSIAKGVIALLLRVVFANRSVAKGANAIALLLSVIALLLGLTSFHAKTWPYGAIGSSAPITGLGIGFYVWMLSFLILLIGCLIPSSPNLSTPPNEVHTG